VGVCVDKDGVLCRHSRGGLVAVVCVMSAGARAEPLLYVEDVPHTELFAGFDASDNAAGGYVGAGYAFGKGLLVGAYARSELSATITMTGRSPRVARKSATTPTPPH